MQLALQLLTMNKPKELEYLLESLANQSDKDWILYHWDNGSEPEARAIINELINKYKDKIQISSHFNQKNLGFDGGHQALFELHGADLVILVNDDAILDTDYVKELRLFMQRNPKCGSCAGSIRRWEFENGQPVKSNVVDSLGLAKDRAWKVMDIEAGKVRDWAHEPPKQVLGVSGCLPMYRREAIEAASYDKCLFDPNYFSYKEDVDLAHRLQRCGYDSYVVPAARARHKRTFRKGYRKRVSKQRQYLSYRNHLWFLLTHLTLRDVLRDGAWIASFECTKFVFIAFTQPISIIKATRDTIKQLPTILAQRKHLNKYP